MNRLSLWVAMLPVVAFLVVAPLRAANQVADHRSEVAMHVVAQATHDLTVAMRELDSRMSAGQVDPQQLPALSQRMAAMSDMLHTMSVLAAKGMQLSPQDQPRVDELHRRSRALIGGDIPGPG